MIGALVIILAACPSPEADGAPVEPAAPVAEGPEAEPAPEPLVDRLDFLGPADRR